MQQKSLSFWLKMIVIGVGLCGLVAYFFILPTLGKAIVAQYPEFSDRYWPWLIFLWSTSIPCYAALVYSWLIAREIGRDNSFSYRNARYLTRIAALAAVDTIYLFWGDMIFFIMGLSHPSVVLCLLFVVFAGIAVTVLAAALSHLVWKAARLREENELTI